jgi:hypothetical protein
LSTSASLARPFLIVGVLDGGVVSLHLHFIRRLGLLGLNTLNRKRHKLDLSSFLVDGYRLGLLFEQVNGLASLA